jgi:hypothetical protein
LFGGVWDRRISYGRIFRIYFSVAHDPTQLNRQGPRNPPRPASADLWCREPPRYRFASGIPTPPAANQS